MLLPCLFPPLLLSLYLMNESLPSPAKRKRFPLLGFLLLLAGAIAACLFFFQKPALDYFVRNSLEKVAKDAGFSVRNATIDGGIGSPLLIKNLVLVPVPGSPEKTRMAVRIDRLEIAPRSLWQIATDRKRLVSRLSITGIQAVLDYREGCIPPMAPLPSFSDEEYQTVLGWLHRIFPERMDFQIDELLVLTDGAYFFLKSLDANFLEDKNGKISMAGGFLQTSNSFQEIPPWDGTTAWKNGVAYIAALPLWEGWTLRALQIDPAKTFLSAEFDAFGGWLRSDTVFGAKDGMPTADSTLWTGKLPVRSFQETLGLDGAVQGEISNAKLRFRGRLDTPLDGQFSLRLQAKNVSWENRGWESLVIGGQIKDRSVELSEFLLEQKENRIAASGSAGWPADGNWKNAEARLKLDAQIENLSSLSALAGDQLKNTAGKMKLQAAVSASGGTAQGDVSASGESLQWKGTPFGSFSTHAVFRGKELSVESFAWKNGNDSLALAGQLHLTAPFLYEGKISASLSDLSVYSPAFFDSSSGNSVSGSLHAEWQGDGSPQAHSGAIRADFEKLCAPPFPAGLTGKLAATYSPDNIFFSQCLLRQNAFSLSWILSAGGAGVFADQISLSNNGKPLVDGQLYLPWNPLCLWNGTSKENAFIPDGELFLKLQTGSLDIAETIALFGQKSPLGGTGKLDASAYGSLDAPVISISGSFANLASNEKNAPVLSPKTELSLTAENGSGKIRGTIEVPKLDPLSVDLTFPFGFRIRDGKLEWDDPTGSLDGKIFLPKTDFSIFHPFLPSAKKLRGTLDGEVHLGNSLAAPTIAGAIHWRDGELEIHRQLPSLKNFHGSCRFDGTSFHLENTGGEIGAGPFEISGGGSFENPSDPKCDIAVSGKQILLQRDRRLRLRADLDLHARGSLLDGTLSGSLLFADGRIYQRMEITPILQSVQTDNNAPLLLPDFSGKVPLPLGNWKLDLKIGNASPFLIVGNIANGEILPDLHLGGSLSDPRLTGEITLYKTRAYLPFSVVSIPEGKIYFREDSPRSPYLDIQGYSKILNYDILMLAQGPLEDKNLILRSDPPLSKEAIILLLTAGIAPGPTGGPALGEAAIGQGSLLVLKTLARQVEPEGIDLDSLLNRVQVVTAPPSIPGMKPSLRGEFRATEQLSVFSERDGYGFLGGGITYTLRFR